MSDLKNEIEELDRICYYEQEKESLYGEYQDKEKLSLGNIYECKKKEEERFDAYVIEQLEKFASKKPKTKVKDIKTVGKCDCEQFGNSPLFGLILYVSVALFVTVYAIYIATFMRGTNALGVISSLIILPVAIASFILWITKFRRVSNYLEWKNKEETFLSTMSSLFTANTFGVDSINYDNAYIEARNNIQNEFEKSKERVTAECSQIEESSASESNEILAKIANADDELSKITVISPKYFYLASDIKDNLLSQRADSIKEALNLAIAESRDKEERQKMQLENERHNQMMEKLAANNAYETMRHNEAMEQTAEQARRDAKYAADQSEHARRQAENRAMARCNTCANAGKCGAAAMMQPNCGGYTPRK